MARAVQVDSYSCTAFPPLLCAALGCGPDKAISLLYCKILPKYFNPSTVGL